MFPVHKQKLAKLWFIFGNVPTFRRTTLLPSSVRIYGPPKRWYPTTSHHITSHHITVSQHSRRQRLGSSWPWKT